ncbi:MAG: GIY-YIG nuclease family protein [Patescibacteria group bacterium]
MIFVYIIKNNFNKLYIGISENPEKRLKFHNTKSGAIFTKSGHYKIIFKEEYSNLKEARQREIQIKKWSRKKKEFLIEKYKKNLPTKI